MNIVLMTSRSGSSLVCKILAAHGLRWRDGNQMPMQQARGTAAGYYTYEHPTIKAALKKCTPNGHWPMGDMVKVSNRRLDIMKKLVDIKDIDFVKAAAEFADLWLAWAAMMSEPINFIKVYRPPEDIADSLMRRGLGEWQLGYEISEKRLGLMESLSGRWVSTNLLVKGDWTSCGITQALDDVAGYHDEKLIVSSIEYEKFHV